MIKQLIFVFFVLFFVPLVFAELNNSEVNIFAQGVNYVVNMFTFGSQGSLTEGVYESRFITTGIETGSSHAQGELYLANVGFLGNSSSLEVTPAPTPTPVTTPTTAVGGGGGAVIVPECLDDSNCDLGEFCFENKCYVYECETDADCNDTKTCWMNRCVKLFDMKIVDLASPIYPGEFFNFTYYLKGVAQIHGDVKVNFWLEKDGIKVTDGYDTIYMGDFEEKLESSKLFLPISILDGVYNFYAEVNYDSYYARASRAVEVSKEFRRLGDYELLDILFRLETREISKPEDLVALIDFESFGTIPAKINYNLIISQKNKEVYSEDGKLTVETSETLRKTFDNLVLKKGFYNMRFNVVYGEGVSEDFNTDFEVIKSFSFVDRVKDFIIKYLTWPIIFLLILFIFVKLRRRFKKKQIDNFSKETYQFFEVSFFKRFFINLKNIFIPKEKIRKIQKKKVILKKEKSFFSSILEKIKYRSLEKKREQKERELEHHKIEVLEQKKELLAVKESEKIKEKERLFRQKRFDKLKKYFGNFYFNIQKKINSKRLEWEQKQKGDELIKRKWDEIRELQKIQEGRFKEIESKREEKLKEEERLSRQKRFNEFKKYFSNFYSNVKKKIKSKRLEWKQKQKENEFIREQEEEKKRLQKVREDRFKEIESKREEKIKEEERLSRQKRFNEFKKSFSNFYSNLKKKIRSKRLEWKQEQKEKELIKKQEEERKSLQKIKEDRLKEIESKKEEKIKEEERLSRQKRFNELKKSFSDFYNALKKKINSKRLEWKQKQKQKELIRKHEEKIRIEEKRIKDKLLREKIIEEKKYKEKISEIKRIQDKKIKKSLSNLKDVEKDIDKIKGFDKIKEPIYNFFKKIKQVNLKPKPSQKKIVIEKELILDVNKPLNYFRNFFKKKPSFKPIDESNQKSKLFLDENLDKIPSESSIKNEVSPKNSKSFLDFIKELGNRNKISFPKKENDSEEILNSFMNQKFNPKPKRSFLSLFYEKKDISKKGEDYEK